MPRDKYSYDFLLPKIDILKSDFTELAKKLNEQYSPTNLTALANIGTVLMTMTMLELEERFFPSEKAVSPSMRNDTTQTLGSTSLGGGLSSGLGSGLGSNLSPVKTDEDIYNDIQDEFDGAQKYLHDFNTTQEIGYKQMAKDELRHSDFLLKRARISGDATKLQPYIDRYNQLLEQLK